jgi:hypothetical protein
MEVNHEKLQENLMWRTRRSNGTHNRSRSCFRSSKARPEQDKGDFDRRKEHNLKSKERGKERDHQVGEQQKSNRKRHLKG